MNESESVSVEKGLAYRICYGFLGTVIFIFLWTLIGYLIFTKPEYKQFSGLLPLPTIKAFYSLIFDNDFWSSVYASLRRVTVGISIAFVMGLPLGLLIGFYKKLELITYTPVQFVRMISPVSWMPVALLVFRSFESAIYFLIAISTVWPIILNTTHGVSRVNPQWINMARNQGAKNYQLLLKIIVPSSVPYILTSLRLALGVAWIVLVPAEFLGVSSGLGYIINDARDTMEYDRLMAIIIAIGIVGFILDGSIQLIQKSFPFKRTWN
ncbi:ABC transporter permease [Desulfonema magnum]|uniref:ABC transporter permease n=1 Tax=Desulfonema magnum TaxID=45655 RepID=UPI001FE5B5A8|nr:ABC transporter permease [Desulfonema magnum]